VRFSILLPFSLCFLLLIFVTSVYAYSFDDAVSWISNFFRITGYQIYGNETTTTTEPITTTTALLTCPYECCSLKDPVYQGKTCEYPKNCVDGKCISVETTTTTTTPTTTVIKEQVKCIFTDTDAMQKCYANDGKFGCIGIGSCMADVAGEAGTKLVWKSSCPDTGYVETTIDGNTKYVAFKCATPTTAIPTPTGTPVTIITPAEVIKEQVKCIFTNSNSDQKCYAEGFACGGTGTCVVDVSGEKGKMLTWKSSCGGYAYTVMDGNNEYVEFNCQSVQTTTQVTTQTTAKIPVYVFTSSDNCIQCANEAVFLKDLQQKYPQIDIRGYTVDSSENLKSFFAEMAARFGVSTNIFPTTFIDSKAWQGFVRLGVESTTRDVGTEIENQIKYCIVNVCEDPNPPKPVPAPSGGAVPSTSTQQSQPVSEQVQCRFVNSDFIFNPLNATPEKCYTDDGKFGCTGNWVAAEESGKKYAYCTVDVSGNMGTKLTWKSSCGGYAYTVIDGNSEYAEFTCIPSSNVTTEQIVGKGFLYAYWQCYDGVEQKTAVGAQICQFSEFWQRMATDICKNHCNADGSKCGVNSFSVSRECYVDLAVAGTIFIPSAEAPQATQPTAVPTESATAQGKVVKVATPMLICKDSCPLNDKCYPFGYRKEGKFCSDEGSFIDQLKENSVCENNFECTTNVCVDGKCISSGLIQKIMNFFKNLFGLV